jgi:hypothetical protein
MAKANPGLNSKLMKEVAKVSAETAVHTALEHLEKEKQRQQKSKKDRRLRNTKLLLKNYRSFVLHCEDIKLELRDIEHPDDILEELNTNEVAVEAIKRSKERTLAMVQFIDQMLLVYRIMCEQSNRPEELRRYKIIEMMYVSEKKFTSEKISDCHSIDKRTVFRDVNKACETLSALMFGVDGIRMVD